METQTVVFFFLQEAVNVFLFALKLDVVRRP